MKHVPNAWSVRRPCMEFMQLKSCCFDALGTRRSFRSRRVVFAVEDVYILAK